MNRKVAYSIGAAALLAATAAFAQAGPDYNLPPNAGETDLVAGFLPDPLEVQLQAGGDLDAGVANLGVGCGGFISAAPDYRIQYTPGEYPLSFLVLSAADTTLLINAPDGTWTCDDDSWGDFNPLATFETPLAGQYDIWVGVYGGADVQDATLFVTETDPAGFPAPGDVVPGGVAPVEPVTPPVAPTAPVTPPTTTPAVKP